MGRLIGKTALITGAARGMGEAHARLFADEGAKVVLTDVLDDAGEAVAADLRVRGHDALYVHLDVTEPDQWTSAVRAAEDSCGPIGILVNNAGVATQSPVCDTSDDDWDRVIAINQRGVFLGMRHTIPSMLRAGRGSIVNISSVFGVCGSPGYLAYHASKSAVIGMTKSAAVTHARDGIRVNAVCPGIIFTPMMDAEDQTAVAAVVETVPFGRGGQPREVSYGVLFLACDESSFVTGVVLPIDGGQLAD